MTTVNFTGTSMTCTCHNTWPCPHQNTTCAAPAYLGQMIPVAATWPPAQVAPRISDDDVERIAKRVVELMRGEP